MTNIYGVPDEVRGNAPLEATEPVCSYCLSPLTELLRYEQDSEGANIVVYKCGSCDTIVKLPVDEIPF